MESKFKKKCDEASDGLIAVDMYYRNMTKTCCDVRYTLILTDIQMPNMDGIAEAQQIKFHEQILRRKDPSLPQMRIVMVSAYDYPETVERARKIGVNDYLIKPVSVDKLIPICKEVYPDENFENWLNYYKKLNRCDSKYKLEIT